MHEMKLHAEPFSRMYAGKKNTEIRLNDKKRQAVSVGDTILFVNPLMRGEWTRRTVIKIDHFRYLTTLLASGIASVEDITLAHNIYAQDSRYRYGFVVFTLVAKAGQ